MFESERGSSIENILKEKFLELRLRNPSFSLRAYAKKLDLSSGALSDILNGKRRVSRKVLKKLIERLGIDDEAKIQIMNQFERNQLDTHLGKAPPSQFLRISADQFRSIADWYHYAILSLMNTDDFQSDHLWIADRLGISNQVAEQAVERLMRLGMISVDESGSFRRSAPNFETSDDVANISIRQAHMQNLELAQKSLDQHDVAIRDFSFFTMAVSAERLPRAKAMIRRFQEELAAEFSNGSKDEVYRLSTQLFPLTCMEKPEKKS